MSDFKYPGVYRYDPSSLSPSVAQVETAIPVFIGYTEKAIAEKEADRINRPTRINSLLDYQRIFGGADTETGIAINVNTTKTPVEIHAKITDPSNYQMFYAMQAYFDNGGGKCYIISVGDYSNGHIERKALLNGLEAAGKVDEITLIVFPDGPNMSTASDYYALVENALEQCVKLKGRFTVCDVYMHNDPQIDDVDILRDTLSNTSEKLKYGAAYYPYLEMALSHHYDAKDVTVDMDGTVTTLAVLAASDPTLFHQIERSIIHLPLILPPAAVMVGIYAGVDRRRGVWKAPANVSVNRTIQPNVKVDNEAQERLNVDVRTGKSVNAIRSFPGRGTIVWGARTLAGNDNDWRYISVVRLFNMVEASVKKALSLYASEPNDSGTWIKVKATMANFLIQQWKGGALVGARPSEAFFVRVGLNETMTELDVQEGRLFVELGIAAQRPAEFVMLRCMQKMKSP